MKIGIAADHRGYDLKQQLINILNKEYEIVDFGTSSKERTDFVDYGLLLGKSLSNKEIDLAIGICGSGIAVSMVLNKIKGVRCALVFNEKVAIHGKETDGCNAIAFPAEHLNLDTAVKCVQSFIESKFLGGVYQRRIDKLSKFEEEQ